MHVLPGYSRIALLTEGRLGIFSAKTAASLLRYRAQQVVAVVDSAFAGRDIRELVPWSPPVPIVSAVTDLLPLAPQALFIGVAPVGGALPPAMRRHVADALRAGLDLVNGLHTRLADDGELRALADAAGARVFDLRRPPAGQLVASARARETRCRRILTVGTDCNVGKMVAALELAAAARRRGLDARFVATGQTGIMIAGRGITIDAVVSDFVAGAVESLVLDAGDSDVCFVEGQGSLGHPGYSGVMLSLLHGACPHALVLVHHVGRTHYSAEPHRALPPLSRLVAAYAAAAELLYPARVVAVALNSAGATAEQLAAERARIERELKLPAADLLVDGADGILDAVLE